MTQANLEKVKFMKQTSFDSLTSLENTELYAVETDIMDKFQVVSVLPANPDPNTFYFIPEA